jgi:hypothetical protein
MMKLSTHRAEQKDRDGYIWHADEAEQRKIQEPGCGCRRQSGNDGAPGASAVGVVARPNTRNNRCHEMTAGGEANDEGAGPQALMHMER